VSEHQAIRAALLILGHHQFVTEGDLRRIPYGKPDSADFDVLRVRLGAGDGQPERKLRYMRSLLYSFLYAKAVAGKWEPEQTQFKAAGDHAAEALSVLMKDKPSVGDYQPRLQYWLNK
jgi:hypothetical protein